MSISEQLCNLRAGSVIAAGCVNEHTTRAWLRNNGLRLGDRDTRESGHPRYDLADAARLTMMRFLTERLSMAAGPAVAATNIAYDYLAELAGNERFAIDDPRLHPNCKRYVMVIHRVDGSTGPNVYEHSDLVAGDDGEGYALEVRIELRLIVRIALDRLLFELGSDPDIKPAVFLDIARRAGLSAEAKAA